MRRLKQTVFAAVAVAAIACLPIRPAAAAGPLLFAPWALGHIVLPLIVASAAASVQPQVPGYYGGAPGYYGGAPGSYAPPNYYYPPASMYYAPSRGYYPQAYYRPGPGYALPAPRFYSPLRGYYPSRPTYSGPYGGQGSYRSGSFGYRRR